MTPWFLKDSDRLTREREGVDKLAQSVTWLVGAEWKLEAGLCLDAVIRAHGHDYEVRVTFPALYPDAPATVRPRNFKERLSTHQYGGADGPLCLEWGPDNWHPNVTAVQMLESTYKLFDTENPLGSEKPVVPVVAPSRHSLTLGQDMRNEWPWLESNGLLSFLMTQPMNSTGSFKFSFRKKGENRHVLIHDAAAIEGASWKDEQIPSGLPGTDSTSLNVGVWTKVDLAPESLGQPGSLTELKNLLEPLIGETYLATDGTSPVNGFEKSIAAVLVVDKSGATRFYIVFSNESVFPLVKISAEPQASENRAPDVAIFEGKTVGIVGLGSAGSKIAISLARMGIRKFYLVDYDILLPGNLRRHALDWQSVLEHKVEGVREAIKNISAGIDVEVSRLHLTGQESNAAVSGALDRLARCDLIIDATANPRAFNLLAAAARNAARPMIWFEIYAGGFGGMVARSRPNIDPTPQDMRNAYLQYCAANASPDVPKQATNYGVETEDGTVLTASDADVSLIASHAARFVPDCFLNAENSRFPFSMYLVGLSKKWVFEAPFATIPISLEAYSISGWNADTDKKLSPENTAFILQLLVKPENANPHPT
jgi:hypothetical protein